MTIDKLVDTIQQAQQYEPKAVKLLRERRVITGTLYPQIDSRQERNQILRELLANQEAAQAMLDRLKHLKPVPLSVPTWFVL